MVKLPPKTLTPFRPPAPRAFLQPPQVWAKTWHNWATTIRRRNRGSPPPKNDQHPLFASLYPELRDQRTTLQKSQDYSLVKFDTSIRDSKVFKLLKGEARKLRTHFPHMYTPFNKPRLIDLDKLQLPRDDEPAEVQLKERVMFWNLTVGDSVRVVPHLKPAEYVHSKDKKEDYMKRYGLDLIRPKKVIDPTSTPWVTHDYSVEVPEGRHQPPMIYRIKRTHKRANVCVLEYQAPYELKYDEFGNPENPDDEGKLRWVELDQPNTEIVGPEWTKEELEPKPNETLEERDTRERRKNMMEQKTHDRVPIFVSYKDLQLLVPRKMVLKLAEIGGYPAPPDIPVFASELKEVVEVEQDADGNPDANGFGPWDREIITTSPRMPKDLMEGLIIPWPTEKGCGFGEREPRQKGGEQSPYDGPAFKRDIWEQPKEGEELPEEVPESKWDAIDKANAASTMTSDAVSQLTFHFDRATVAETSAEALTSSIPDAYYKATTTYTTPTTEFAPYELLARDELRNPFSKHGRKARVYHREQQVAARRQQWVVDAIAAHREREKRIRAGEEPRVGRKLKREDVILTAQRRFAEMIVEERGMLREERAAKLRERHGPSKAEKKREKRAIKKEKLTNKLRELKLPEGKNQYLPPDAILQERIEG